MRISVAEERNGQRQAEREFESTSVEVGRDSRECQIVFDGQEWPMVSRRHAEFRFEGDRCLLVDTNSRFGTFLDGRPISEPTEIRVGSRAQFGPGGPVLRVLRVERLATEKMKDVAPNSSPLGAEPAFLELASDVSS